MSQYVIVLEWGMVWHGTESLKMSCRYGMVSLLSAVCTQEINILNKVKGQVLFYKGNNSVNTLTGSVYLQFQ